jgi:hypothetical protein
VDEVTSTRARTALLCALMAVPAMVEAGSLRAVGLSPALGLAPQFGVPGAIGTFHDLRWALVYHDSWLSFAGLLGAIILGRGAFTAAAVWLAWPDEKPPRTRELLRDNLIFAVVSVLVLVPWAAVAMAASETSLSWFVLGEVVPLIILATAMVRGPMVADWWRRAPGLAPVGWMLLLLAAVTGGAMVVALTPGWWVVPVAGASGVVNALIWRQLVGAALRPVAGLSRRPIAAVMVAALYGALLLSGTLATFGSSTSGDVRGDAQPFDVTGLSVMYIGGYDSEYNGTPVDGSRVEIFSYRGLDQHGQPVPYGAADTHQSVDHSARLLADQVTTLHARTGQPVGLVAESEGTLVLRDYLDTQPHPAVTSAVMMSPLVRPGRIYYPPPGASVGWGLAGGWVLRGLLWVVRLTNSSQISPDEPFVRSVLDRAPLYRNRMLCPVPGVRMMGILPTAEAAVVPPELHPDIPVLELPGVHASLESRADVQAQVHAFLSGDPPVDHAGGPGYSLIQTAGAAWQAPALPIRLNLAWPQYAPDSSFGEDGCSYPPG